MVHLPQTRIFWEKSLILFSYTYRPFSLCKILKKFWQRIQSYEYVPFLGPKWPICPNKNFFRKPIKTLFISFMPIYIPKINFRYQSIYEILTIKDYWNLIGQEPFLTITWEADFSQAYSFHRMLMDHKNFRFIPIPDKINDLIFKV